MTKGTYTAFDGEDLTTDDHDYASSEIDCDEESKFLLMYSVTETGTLVDGDRIKIRMQFREAAGTWRDLQDDPFDTLFEEKSSTPCNIAISGKCLGEKARLVVTTDYTNADPSANYFTITAKITLVRP